MAGWPKYLQSIKVPKIRYLVPMDQKLSRKGRIDVHSILTQSCVLFQLRNSPLSLQKRRIFAQFAPRLDPEKCGYFIANECNTNQQRYTDFGYTFKPPTTFKYGSEGCKQYLAGSQKFQVKEIEAFEVELK
ncbi:hypothetical protein FGO68_gene16758 [Halteria grandinella]|uniref:Uncharacterized protein n=1 Tax=Halteria grandinella TaxID=5974 RepID=A0A8J8T0G5_HALGN|nr:hypothetical protein FGO68_gene16758 [Halteria grandinella]